MSYNKCMLVVMCMLCWLGNIMPPAVQGSYYSKKLYEDLLRTRGYNKLMRPVQNESEMMIVTLGVKLSQLIDVDEKNQAMTANVWVIQEWQDPNLRWNPNEYDNVTTIYVPAKTIWHPDIVLYNNADGNYMLTDTKAIVSWKGHIIWSAPALLKSSCNIDARYFPFDEQSCEMSFGSWTYHRSEVDIVHIWQNRSDIGEFDEMECGIDMKHFIPSVEWDVMRVPSRKKIHHYAGSVEPFPELRFMVTMRRKYLFYTVNLIIPLTSHAILTILVFYLPSDSREKVSISINILLSLTVYFLILADTIPPTSIVVPLLAQYLLFTMLLVTMSVIITALTLNIHFRSAATHTMPNWIRKIFLYYLPRILLMKRPKIENSHDVFLKHIKLNVCTCFMPDEGSTSRHNATLGYQFGSKRTKTQIELEHLSEELDTDISHGATLRRRNTTSFSEELQKAIDGAIFIANHLKLDDEFKRTKEDWKYVALVVDRMFLWIYFTLCSAGTIGILCQAPIIFDNILPMSNFNESKPECGFTALVKS